MANNVAVNRYPKSQAAFQSQPGDFLPESDWQVRGWCSQSESHATRALLVEASAASDNSRAVVVHPYALAGCKA